MLLKVFKTECQKLHRSKLSLAIFILPILATVMGSYNYAQNTDILNDLWYSLWTQVSLFYAYFFFPSLIGIYCAYICRLEHTGNNWCRVMSAPIPYASIFIGKLLVVIFLNCITQVVITVLYIVSGCLLGFSLQFPPELFLWMLLGLVGSIAVSAFLLCISLFSRSFAIPVGVGIAGGISGLILLSKGYGLYCPFTLICAGMNTVTPDVSLTSTFCFNLIISSFIFTVIFCLVGIWKLKRLKV